MRMHNVTCLPCQKEHINTKRSESSRCFSSFSEPDIPCTFPSLSSSCSSSPYLKCEPKTQELQSSQTELSLDFTAPPAGNSKEQHLKESSGQNHQSSELHLEYLAAEVVQRVLNNALNVMDVQSQANTTDCFSKSGDQTNCTSTDGSCECKVCQQSADGGRGRLEGKEEKVQEGKRGSRVEENTEWFKKNRVLGRRGTDQENVLDICCHGSCCHGNRPGFDEFKEFLRGAPGEKLLNLWMDIERLKATQNRERKNR